MFDAIGRQDSPPISHPGFYYGFIGVALAWQVAFIVISREPVRLRPMMIPAVIEKFIYAVTFLALYLQSRIHPLDLAFGIIDLLFGILFLTAFFKTAS